MALETQAPRRILAPDGLRIDHNCALNSYKYRFLRFETLIDNNKWLKNAMAFRNPEWLKRGGEDV
jgi:hypothetical protein